MCEMLFQSEMSRCTKLLMMKGRDFFKVVRIQLERRSGRFTARIPTTHDAAS